MKKIVLLFLLGWLSATTATAQTSGRGLWCPPGAVWQHMSISGGFGSPPLLLMLYTAYAGDTIIGGQSCQILRVTRPGFTAVGRLYTRADADRVWRYGGGQFSKMYDFSARPGDSWTYDANAGSPYACLVQLVVDSVGQRFVGGQQRRWFVAHYQSGTSVYRTGRLYEGVGSLQEYFLPARNACIPADLTVGLQAQCYGTTAQPGLIVMNPQANCQAIPTATHAAPARSAGVEVYPTVGSGAVTLKLPGAYARATVSVLNLAGQLVRQLPLGAAPETTLQLGQLPRGLYQLSVRQPGQPVLNRRIVLQ